MEKNFDNEDHRMRDQEEKEKEQEKKPDLEIYKDAVKYLRGENFHIEPSNAGNYAQHDISIVAHPGCIKGLDIPKGFEMLKNIDDIEGEAVRYELINAITPLEHSDVGMYNLLKPFISPTVNKTKPIHAIASQELSRKARAETKRQSKFKDGIALSGKEGNPARAFVPLREWFDPSVRELKARDLLTILPPAERNLFLLILGRVCVGRDFSLTAEGTFLQHAFRSLGILVGLKPGIGKSTLMRYINRSLAFLGYNVATLEKPGSRFGWNKVVRSDLGYVDDLTRKSQKAFIESEDTKTIVSNEVLTTEQKGVDSQTSLSRTVLLANSNDFNQADMFDLDPGVISRINFLNCYNVDELEDTRKFLSLVSQKSPDLRVRPHWHFLSETLDVDPLTLGCWLIHLAAEEFMKTCGYVRDENQIFRQTSEDQLEKVVHLLRKDLYFNSTNDSSENLLVFSRCLLVLGLKRSSLDSYKKEKFLNSSETGLIRKLVSNALILIKEYQTSNSNSNSREGLEALTKILYQDYLDHGKPLIHPWLALQDLSASSCVKPALSEAKRLENLNYTEEEILSGLFSKLYTTQGYRYSGAPQWIKTHWRSAIREDFSLAISAMNELCQHQEEALKKKLWNDIQHRIVESDPREGLDPESNEYRLACDRMEGKYTKETALSEYEERMRTGEVALDTVLLRSIAPVLNNSDS